MKGIRKISFGLLLILIPALFGCRAKEVEVKDKNINTEIKKEFTLWMSDSDFEDISNSVERYSEKQSDLSIELVSIPEAEIYDRLVKGLYSGVDVPNAVLLDNKYVNTLVKRFPSAFEDLTGEFDHIKEKYAKSQLNVVAIDNKIRAIPWNSKPYMMFYRRDIFESSGIVLQDIKTWSEYVEAGKTIHTKTEGKVKMLPLDLQNSDEFLRLVFNQLGEGYHIREGKKNIHRAKYLKAFRLIKDINDAGIVQNLSKTDDLIGQINGGSVASVLMTPDFISTLIDEFGDLSGKWEIRTLPAFEAGGKTAAHLDGNAFMVTTINEDNKEAFEFIKYLITDKENIAAAVVKDDVYPPIEELYNEKWINEKSEYFGNKKIWRVISQSALETDDVFYPLDFSDVQKKVLEIQKDIFVEDSDLTITTDKLLKEMPIIKEK